MNKKRFILNAGNFGASKDANRAIIEGYAEGLLKSASLIANGEAFDDAVENVIPRCTDLGVGIHLNLSEGYSLCSDLELLTDANGKFNNSYFQLLVKSYNPKEIEFFQQVEREFRRQIEKVLAKTQVSHIGSFSYIHSIPRIFEMVCRLAKEYGIKYVQTQFEKLYIIPDLHIHMCKNYLLNLLKLLMLDAFTVLNEATIHRWGLKTNDYTVGIIYDSIMEALALSYGISAVNYNNITVEAVIYPCRYEDGTVNNNFTQYLITRNKKLKEKIKDLGFEITNYAEKEN